MKAAATAPAHIDDTGERPVVSGTDIKVSQVARECDLLGMTADEVVEAHPHLTLADVHAALAYYHDHREAIRLEWREARAVIGELRRRYPGSKVLRQP